MDRTVSFLGRGLPNGEKRDVKRSSKWNEESIAVFQESYKVITLNFELEAWTEVSRGQQTVEGFYRVCMIFQLFLVFVSLLLRET